MLKVIECALCRGAYAFVVVVLSEPKECAPDLAVRGGLARLREDREARRERGAHRWPRVPREANKPRHEHRERADAFGPHRVAQGDRFRLRWLVVLMLPV